MKISDGLKLKGCPVEIPECSRDDLPEFFKERGFKVGVEIGVYKAEFTEVIAKSGLKIYGVDPWKDYKDYLYGRNQRALDELYEVSAERLSPYPNAKIIRKTSVEALDDFGRESIDFVYIDGNHRFKFVAEDIEGWWHKVKVGGIVCGHDYAYFKHRFPGAGCQVKEIVDAFARSFDIKNFWILGRRNDKIRDRFRSWMILKTK